MINFSNVSQEVMRLAYSQVQVMMVINGKGFDPHQKPMNALMG